MIQPTELKLNLFRNFIIIVLFGTRIRRRNVGKTGDTETKRNKQIIIFFLEIEYILHKEMKYIMLYMWEEIAEKKINEKSNNNNKKKLKGRNQGNILG